ncbi:MAG: DUF5107 domain-containing protein [Planctomycetes bacterium]|nr:DUF5107 domain-containing protein [Planctomycetota bacterium]
MTELRMQTLEMPAADLGGENPLPMFRGLAQDIAFESDGSIPKEDAKYIGWRCTYRVAPYRIQDGYDRNKIPRKFQVAVLENEHLTATFAPSLGGRLLSLYDKTAKRELLDRNPVFQPANLALRNAWFSGGIEFNTSHFGHHFLTCAPMFAARVRGSQGEPVLRMYEWERAKCFPYQIDFHLPAGSRFLFSRVRIVNPHDHEIPMYWWTNIAVPENKGTRVICPADSAIGSIDHKRMGLVPVPMFQGLDISYAHNMPGAREYFFRIPDGQRRWEAAVEADGKGLVHTSTRLLRGRKVFYWGMNEGGRQWQEFLSVPGRTYVEIQAGLGRTQLEHLPMPARASWEWTEAFGLIDIDPKKAHAADWSLAQRTVETDLAMKLPESRVDALDRDFAAVTTRKAEEILATGSGWGALERKRLAAQKQVDRIPAELAFDVIGPEQQPWLDLLERGAFPAADAPGHLMVQTDWQRVLEESLKAGKGDHWLAWWHLGNMRLENHDVRGAKEAWETSLARSRTGWALRNLSVIAARATLKEPEANAKPGQPEPASREAADLLEKAWETGPKIVPLAIEYARMLIATEQNERMAAFAQTLPAEIRNHERFRIFSAFASMHMGELEKVEPLFTQDFATIREGEVTLTDIWFGYHERRIAKAEGIPLDAALTKRVRKDFPPPKRIDFRMIQDIV